MYPKTNAYRIRDNWQYRCQESGVPLPAAVLSEFKKRILQASSSHSKAKLSFANLDLVDKQVKSIFM